MSPTRVPDDGEALSYRARPCQTCPWRTDVPGTMFPDTDMIKLRNADGQPGAEAWFDAPMMSCHKDQPGTSHEWRLCAGWLATIGADHLGVRLAIARGRLDRDAPLSPQPGWPDLHPSTEALINERRKLTN